MIPPRLSKTVLNRLVEKHGSHAVSHIVAWREQVCSQQYARTTSQTAFRRRLRQVRRVDKALRYVEERLAGVAAASQAATSPSTSLKCPLCCGPTAVVFDTIDAQETALNAGILATLASLPGAVPVVYSSFAFPEGNPTLVFRWAGFADPSDNGWAAVVCDDVLGLQDVAAEIHRSRGGKSALRRALSGA